MALTCRQYDIEPVFKRFRFPARLGRLPRHSAATRPLTRAARMGYDIENGIVISNSGFLNVSVSPDEVTVEYIKNVYDCDRDCGEVVDSYTISAN